MQPPNDRVEDLRLRLRKVVGQVKAIERMLADGRECRDVLTQLSAANKALERVGFILLAASLRRCIEDPEASAADGYQLADIQRLFLKLA